LDVCADLSDGDTIGHYLSHGLGLNRGNIRSNGGSHGLLNSLRVIDDTGRNPDLGEGCRLDDCAELSSRDIVGHDLSLSLCSKIGGGCRLRVDVGLGLGLSSSESVLDGHCVVDDFGGHPDTGCWHNFDGGDDLSNVHNIGHCACNSLVHSDCGGNNLGVSLSLSVHLCLCLEVRHCHRHRLYTVVVVTVVVTVIVATTVAVLDADNRRSIALETFREPRLCPA